LLTDASFGKVGGVADENGIRYGDFVMTKCVKGICCTAGILAVISMPLSISAQAQAEQSSCADCNRPVANTKVNTSYKYKTVQRMKNVTQYKDVNKTSYQKRINRIVNVTRIQPVTRVNVVTRVHNRTVVLHQTQNVAQTATLPTRTVTTGKTIQINHPTEHRNCNC
jgi:hypothetical protein